MSAEAAHSPPDCHWGGEGAANEVPGKARWHKIVHVRKVRTQGDGVGLKY